MPDNSAFVASLEKASIQIISESVSNMKKACLIVESDSKRRCPVNEGELRASITSDVSVSASKILGIIGSNLMYAPYVHNGTGIYAVNGDGRKTPWVYVIQSGPHAGGYCTVGQKPNPFLEDAKLQNKDRVARTLGGK